MSMVLEKVRGFEFAGKRKGDSSSTECLPLCGSFFPHYYYYFIRRCNPKDLGRALCFRVEKKKCLFF